MNDAFGMYELDSFDNLRENIQTFVDINRRILSNVTHIKPLPQSLVTQLHLNEQYSPILRNSNRNKIIASWVREIVTTIFDVLTHTWPHSCVDGWRMLVSNCGLVEVSSSTTIFLQLSSLSSGALSLKELLSQSLLCLSSVFEWSDSANIISLESVSFFESDLSGSHRAFLQLKIRVLYDHRVDKNRQIFTRIRTSVFSIAFELFAMVPATQLDMRRY